MPSTTPGADTICDYRMVTDDGTPICLRYWHEPDFDVSNLTDPPNPLPAPIPYRENTTTTDASGNTVYTSQEWYTDEFTDTHGRIFKIGNDGIGWYDNV